MKGGKDKLNGRFQAAMGICNLKGTEAEIEKRHHLSECYAEKLKNVRGIHPFNYSDDIRYNHAYFPVIVDETTFGINRDELFKRLNERGIATRKFYNLLTCNVAIYCGQYKQTVPNAERISQRTLDLPIYGNLTAENIEIIVDEISKARGKE